MNGSELRIGNYVYYMDSKKLFWLGDVYFSLEVIKSKCENIRPIPLTEQWFKDFGFDRKGGYNWIKNETEIQMFGTSLRASERDYRFVRYGEKTIYTLTIKHVHQLQNLHFALTNTELIKS